MKNSTVNLKKALSAVLCVIMLFALAIPAVSAADAGVTYIFDEQGLKDISKNMAGHYVLKNDIELTGNWELMGTKEAFTGTLDGAGYAIKNLKMVDAVKEQWGGAALINNAVGATFKNLSVYGEITNNVVVDGAQIAGLVAVPRNTTFTNCKSYVNITVGEKTERFYVGGIAACANKDGVTFDNCRNYGTFNLTNSAKAANGYAGGICAYVKNPVSTIKNCQNYGVIKANLGCGDYAHVGGILGCADYNGNGDITQIINCTNYGYLEGKGSIGGIAGFNKAHKFLVKDCANLANIKNTAATGGILGQSQTGSTVDGVYIEGCQVYGLTSPIAIESKDHVGGIYGYHNAGGSKLSIADCVNFADVITHGRYAAGMVSHVTTGKTKKAFTVTHCANMGDITAVEKAEVFMGGVVGRLQSIDYATSYVRNCFNAGALSAPKKTGGFLGGIAGSEDKIPYENCATLEFAGATGTTLLGYGKATTSTKGSVVIDEKTDLNNVLTTLNGDKNIYRLNKGVIEPLYDLTRENVTFIGTQNSVAANGKFDVRFVSLVNSVEYDKAGYKVAVKVEGGKEMPVKELEVNTVYGALTANTKGGMLKMSAPFGTNYMALVIENVPADKTVTFTVTPYTVSAGTVAEGSAYSVTFVNGSVAN